MIFIIGCLLLLFPLAVEGKDCLCTTMDLQAGVNEIPFTIPKGACAEVTDQVMGFDHSLWYNLNYTGKVGWIQDDQAHMSFSQCPVTDPGCRDISAVCASTMNVCENFKPWAFEYCRKHCNLCGKKPTLCEDEEPTCNLYGKSICTLSAQWAQQKCRQYCGFCEECEDEDKHCSSRGKSICKRYQLWTKIYCRKFCHICNVATTTTTTMPIASSVCKDLDGIDCQWLDSQTHVCSDTQSATVSCPKYCKICDTANFKAIIGR